MQRFFILVLAGIVLGGCINRTAVLEENSEVQSANFCFTLEPGGEASCVEVDLGEGKSLADVMYEADAVREDLWLTVEYIDNVPIILHVNDIYPNTDIGEYWGFDLEGSDFKYVNIDDYIVQPGETWYLYIHNHES